jgi:hypothetical protein
MVTTVQTSQESSLVMDVAEIDRLLAFMQTKSATDAMEYDGVLAETLIFLV